MTLRAVDIEPPEDRARREIREDSARRLREMLTLVEAGELDEVLLVGVTGSDIKCSMSGTLGLSRSVGLLELLKHSMISGGD